EMATQFAKCQFTGIDLVDVFTRDRAPKNCRFQLANALELTSFPSSYFDYIHQRMLVFNIPTARYTELFMGYHRLLKSGGCLELVESDLQLQPAGPVSARLNAMLRLACRARGVDLDYATELDRSLRAAGFRHVSREVLRVPVGAWAGVTGEM
ncbi:hypothetical protein THASP1DRAFT_7891, partial [Thamnocephalis sphaerospora]